MNESNIISLKSMPFESFKVIYKAKSGKKAHLFYLY